MGPDPVTPAENRCPEVPTEGGPSARPSAPFPGWASLAPTIKGGPSPPRGGGTHTALPPRPRPPAPHARPAVLPPAAEELEEWKVVCGKFLAINAMNMCCACARSPGGLSPAAHLGDGSLDLILIRKCSRFNFLRFLIRHTNQRDQVRALPPDSVCVSPVLNSVTVTPCKISCENVKSLGTETRRQGYLCVPAGVLVISFPVSKQKSKKYCETLHGRAGGWRGAAGLAEAGAGSPSPRSSHSPRGLACR